MATGPLNSGRTGGGGSGGDPAPPPDQPSPPGMPALQVGGQLIHPRFPLTPSRGVSLKNRVPRRWKRMRSVDGPELVQGAAQARQVGAAQLGRRSGREHPRVPKIQKEDLGALAEQEVARVEVAVDDTRAVQPSHGRSSKREALRTQGISAPQLGHGRAGEEGAAEGEDGKSHRASFKLYGNRLRRQALTPELQSHRPFAAKGRRPQVSVGKHAPRHPASGFSLHHEGRSSQVQDAGRAPASWQGASARPEARQSLGQDRLLERCAELGVEDQFSGHASTITAAPSRRQP